MSRKSNIPVFKPYIQHQAQLLPQSYDELIEADHLVRVVNDTIEKLDLSVLVEEVQRRGDLQLPSEDAAESAGVRLLQEDLHLAEDRGSVAGEHPFHVAERGAVSGLSHDQRFSGERMKEVIETIFAEVLEYLVEAGYVKLEAYFADGTKIEADANKHKVVWAKRKETYQKRVREQIEELLKEIEQENEAEQAEYGEKDLEERGGPGGGADQRGAVGEKDR